VKTKSSAKLQAIVNQARSPIDQPGFMTSEPVTTNALSVTIDDASINIDD
jgi:ethanolamine utilization protein EutP (predicted NTPase)